MPSSHLKRQCPAASSARATAASLPRAVSRRHRITILMAVAGTPTFSQTTAASSPITKAARSRCTSTRYATTTLSNKLPNPVAADATNTDLACLKCGRSPEQRVEELRSLIEREQGLSLFGWRLRAFAFSGFFATAALASTRTNEWGMVDYKPMAGLEKRVTKSTDYG